MKIAVYAIAKNEQSNVAGWLENVKDADGIFVFDTGSADETISMLREGGAVVNQMNTLKVFRFDHARNEAMSYVPDDYDVLVSLDFDERLSPDWRQAIEENFTAEIDAANYTLVYDFDEAGNVRMSYPRMAVHRPKSVTWQYAVHEICIPIVKGKAVTLPFYCVHYGQPKEPGHYLDLLKLAHAENPDDARNLQYLAREYYAMSNFAMADQLYKQHMDIEEYPPFRSESARRVAHMATDYEIGEWWFRQAVQYCNNIREPYCELADFYFYHKQYEHCIAYVRSALLVERPTYDMIYSDKYYNGSWCNHMLMACYQQIGNLRAAQQQKDILLQMYEGVQLPPHVEKDIALVERATQEALYVYLDSVGVQR